MTAWQRSSTLGERRAAAAPSATPGRARARRPNTRPCQRPHDPIFIDGDAGFTRANGVTGGSGTSSDPYRIQSWAIAPGSATAGILVRNSTAFFVIWNVQVAGGQYFGIWFENAANGRIERSQASSTFAAVQIDSSRNVAVLDSRLLGSTTGIAVTQSAGVTLTGNDISRNQLGISLSFVTGGVVAHNNLLNNNIYRDFPGQAVDEYGSNTWDAGYPSGGNYWTDYMGVDNCSGAGQDLCTGSDGIGDTPYVIDFDSLDRYPLMAPPGSAGDTVPPTVTIAFPPDGATETSQQIDVTGSAADSGSGLRRVDVRLNGGPWTIANGTATWDLPVFLDPGPNLIEARAIDHAGNVSAVASAAVTFVVPQLVVTVRTDKSVYTTGEPVGIDVVVSNLTAQPVTLHFSSSCQALFRVLNSAGGQVFDLGSHVGCLAILTQQLLQPGESKTYSFGWNQVDDLGRQVPVPADYVVVGYMASFEPVPQGRATISIQPPSAPPQWITVTTDKSTYVPGEAVRIGLTLTNITTLAVTLHFPTSCQTFFRVRDGSGTVLYDEFRHATCLDVLTDLTLQPGQSQAYSFAWAQVDDSGHQVAVPGDYVIEGYADSFEAIPSGQTTIGIRLPFSTAVWLGVPQVLTLVTNLDVETLPDATLVGQVGNFQTTDPVYTCLNG